MRIIISSSRADALQYLLMRSQVRICNSRGLVFLFTLLSISTFRARDCSGVMCPGLRFVHNYPIRAYARIYSCVRVFALRLSSAGQRNASEFTAIGRSAAVKALAFGSDRVRVRAAALRSARTIKSIFAGEAAVYLSIAINYMRAVYGFFAELHI